MRFSAPARNAIDPDVLARPPLSLWSEFSPLLSGSDWPALAELNAALAAPAQRFVAQTPALLADGLHYEQRIAERGEIATREENWHDLLNALVWLRFPELKAALNARQVSEISRVGPRARTRAQCALTHFDEGGAIVVVRDPRLLALWDAHDWRALFLDERAAWRDGRLQAFVFGHALLEHALLPKPLLVAKAVAVFADLSMHPMADASRIASTRVAAQVLAGRCLNDPQELRSLPLCGMPSWHDDNERAEFYASAPCFRPLREGRRYPPPLYI